MPAQLPPRRLIVAVSGASGSGYARLLLQHVLPRVPGEVALLLSANAGDVLAAEEGATFADLIEQLQPNGRERLRLYDRHDFGAPFASGSNAYDAMVIVPASGGLLGRIAHGLSDCLITRAAEVCLKERRPLIVVPRETPVSVIALRNQLALAEAGAIILPACPSFYGQPRSVEDVQMTVVDRLLDQLGLARSGASRWSAQD